MNEQNATPAGDQARATVLVKVPPEAAFQIFTEEIETWWRRGRRFRNMKGDRGFIHLEPQVGGRLFESFEKGAETKVLETGRVLVWDPPSRLVFSWRGVNFSPSESTEVEVVFKPSPSGTLVTVTHRGWSQLRADHPARHGKAVPAFIGTIAMWWGELLTSLREHAANVGSPPAPD